MVVPRADLATPTAPQPSTDVQFQPLKEDIQGFYTIMPGGKHVPKDGHRRNSKKAHIILAETTASSFIPYCQSNPFGTNLSSDRPYTMFASKTAMQHVSKPNVLMNARLQRLGRYYEGKPLLVWCYPLQELPNGIRVDGDGDWSPTTELLRMSTSGGAVRYGLHTWDCYPVTQATIALSSAESEFFCDR